VVQLKRFESDQKFLFSFKRRFKNLRLNSQHYITKTLKRARKYNFNCLGVLNGTELNID